MRLGRAPSAVGETDRSQTLGRRRPGVLLGGALERIGELFPSVDRNAPVFRTCRESLFATGEPLLERAQQAGVVRADTNITEILQLVGGIAKISSAEPEQIERILEVALDGLRYQPAAERQSERSS